MSIASTNIYNNDVTTDRNIQAAGTVSSGTGFMFRNLLINGDMRINQRGTIASNISGSGTKVYTVDRWFFTQNNTASNALANLSGCSLDTGLVGTGIDTLLRIQRPNGSTSTQTYNVCQSIETINVYRAAGKTMSFSFYVRKGADYAGLFKAYIQSGTGTDENAENMTNGGWTGITNVASFTTITPTTAWTRWTFKCNIPSSCKEIGVWFQCNYTGAGTAGAADYIDITGVQLEIGDMATPFEFRPYPIELQLCQRYFECSYSTAPSTWGGTDHYYEGIMTTALSSYYVLGVPFKVTKRAVPVVTCYSKTGTAGYLTDGSTNLAVASVDRTIDHINRVAVTGVNSAFLIWDASAEL